MIKTVDVVIVVRWLLPVVPKNTLLEHYAVVVHEGLVVDICTKAEAAANYLATESFQLNEHVLMPGFINLHTHAAMSLMRGLADDLPLMPWLKEHIWPAEKQFVASPYVYDGTLLACAEMLSGGVTTFNDMYFYPEATIDAATLMGMRTNIGLVVLGFATNYAADARSYMVKGTEVKDRYSAHPLVTFSFAPHAPYSVSEEDFMQVNMLAEQLDIGIHTHMHETQQEIAESQQRVGLSPILKFANAGLLSARMTLAHCVHLTEAEIGRLAEFGCHIAHCPSSNLKLASGIAPIAHCVEKGINVGLGTDGAASNNRLDMFAEMRLAALLAKVNANDATVIPAYQAIEMATINGAKALGLEQKIGSIEIGKLADFTVVRMSDIALQPCFDPVSHLVYVAGRENVSHVWVDGKLQYHQPAGQQGMFSQLEPREITEVVRKWQVKLQHFKGV